MTEDTRDVYEHVLSLLEVEEATSVVDLGCGRGEQLRMLGESARPGARLVGLDFRENVLEEARSAAGDDPRFVVLHHDVNEGLPFEDGELDRVLSVNALEAVSEKAAFVREAHRVLKPGGRLVCAHYDWESQLYDGPDKELIRRIVEGSAESKLLWMTTNDGWMGRRLWGIFRKGGSSRVVWTPTRTPAPDTSRDAMGGSGATTSRASSNAVWSRSESTKPSSMDLKSWLLKTGISTLLRCSATSVRRSGNETELPRSSKEGSSAGGTAAAHNTR